MSDWVRQWALAFALTQAVEIPVYWRFSRGLPTLRRWLHAAGASTLTHPLLWFALPWQEAVTAADHARLVIVGEAGVLLVESAWGRLLRVPRPIFAATVANAASFLAGVLLR